MMRPSERGVFADARAGLRHLLEVRGFPPSRVVLFGRSIGGAVAVEYNIYLPVVLRQYP